MSTDALPELAGVSWRPRVNAAALRRSDRLWTLSILAQVVPMPLLAVVLVAADRVMAPALVLAAAYAWTLPELYAARGARVLAPARRTGLGAERLALGLLGDLVDHERRELYARSGLVLERGAFGTWLVGEAGAVVVCPGGRRVRCLCVRIPEPDLPGADRTSHLLLALRSDEVGFLTIANQAFSGATWRLRRRLPAPMRVALRAAADTQR